jgi:signal peptidase I
MDKQGQNPAQEQKRSEQKENAFLAAAEESYGLFRFICAIMAAIVAICTFFVMIVTVSGSSMYPTLHDGDVMLVQRTGYTPQPGDVVVVRDDAFLEEAIVKRCIAVGGQSVEIDYDENRIYVDGVALDEDYLNFTTSWPDETGTLIDHSDVYGDDYMVEKSTMVYSSFVVPEGCIFVMGDNRNGSADSRLMELGMVDTRYVVGHVLGVAFPFQDAKLLTNQRR